jgi:DNA-binding NarL/FixJ family response regulator
MPSYPITDAVSISRTRLVLADDDVLLREGLAGLPGRSGFEVVGRAGTPSGLIELVREVRPDLGIVDIRMPPTHMAESLGADAAIREEFPESAIVVLTAHVQVERATELLSGGERVGYFPKSPSRTWTSSSTRWSGSRAAP